MRRLFRALPGPPAARVVMMVVLAAALLVLLGLVFERAGDLLDNGGVIGPTG